MKTLSQKVCAIQESATLAFGARVLAMKRKGIDVCSLTAGEPDFPTPDYIKRAGINAIEENFTRYTDNAGIPELREAIAAKFRRDNGMEFEPGQILVSGGAKHSVFNALQALCDPGDEVIIPAPYWVSYPDMVQLVDAEPVIVKTKAEEGFILQPEALRKAISMRTKALIFTSPSNPTGAVHTPEQIRALAAVVREFDIYVISDEIYEKLVYDGLEHLSMGSIPGVRDHVITVNGMSKAYAMTGWRIGYLGASKPVVEAASKIQSQVTSNISSISQRAALAALTAVGGGDGEIGVMREQYRRRRDYMMAALRTIPGLKTVEPKGAFYLFPSIEAFLGKKYHGQVIANDYDFAMYLLNELHLGTVPGSPFGAPGHIRISYAASQSSLEKGAALLKKGIEQLE